MSAPTWRLRTQIALFVLIRTLVNTGFRMVYPFLPALARGAGVSLETMALAVTARNGLGLAGPLLGAIGDTHGRRVGMLLGMALFSGGLLLVLIWPTYPTLFAALVISGASRIVFDPAMQAYLGDRIPYERRGLALGLTELSWSTAYLVGMPGVGWLMARAGWRSPFAVLALLGLGMALALGRVVPADRPDGDDPASVWVGVRVVAAHSQAVAGLAFILLISTSVEMVSIVYGAWLEGSFGVALTGLGAASAVIGIAELGGEGLVAGLVDRVGKRRAVAGGAALFALACAALPLLGQSLPGAIGSLFLFAIAFEFTLVSSIPLMTELVPRARAAMMSANVAAVSAGHMLGAVAGPRLFQAGIGANGAVAAALALLGLTVLLLFMRTE